jgi:hypothetical protein
MPVTLAVDDLLRVRFYCTAGDQASVNTMFWKVVATSGAPTTDLNAADEFDFFMGPFYKALMPASAQYDGCTVQVVRKPPMTPQVGRASAGVGTDGTIAMPRQVSSLVSYLTANAGRRYRGRSYLPFPPVDAAQTDGQMTTAYKLKVAQWSAQWASITGLDNSLTAPTGFVTVVQVVPHFLKKGQVGPEEPPTTVTNVKPGELFATQRRRGSFGRQNTSPV